VFDEQKSEIEQRFTVKVGGFYRTFFWTRNTSIASRQLAEMESGVDSAGRNSR